MRNAPKTCNELSLIEPKVAGTPFHIISELTKMYLFQWKHKYGSDLSKWNQCQEVLYLGWVQHSGGMITQQTQDDEAMSV